MCTNKLNAAVQRLADQVGVELRNRCTEDCMYWLVAVRGEVVGYVEVCDGRWTAVTIPSGQCENEDTIRDCRTPREALQVLAA